MDLRKLVTILFRFILGIDCISLVPSYRYHESNRFSLFNDITVDKVIQVHPHLVSSNFGLVDFVHLSITYLGPLIGYQTKGNKDPAKIL